MAEAGNQQPEPAATSLREADAEHARFANSLHRLLTAAPGMQVLRGWHERDPALQVFADGSGMLWCPLGECNGIGENLDAQMELLSHYDAALCAFERATGLAFDPATVTTDWRAGARWVELRYGEHRFAFGFEPQRIDAAKLPPLEPEPAVSRTPFPVVLSFRTGNAPLTEVEALSSGGLLSLSAGPYPTILETPLGARRLPGHWTPKTGVFAPATCQGEQAMSEPKQGAAPAGLHVPLTIRLPQMAVPAAEIEALAEGGTVTLTPLSEGLAAELLVAGQIVAAGEIVRLGGSFAFLVDAMNAPPRAAEDPAIVEGPTNAPAGDGA
ncbi:FliM/FliN family flagellar motor switch protein [Qipengyuania qiaonensis]|uniref:FliM/FliN family flagellar motor switch protein n=1 Tax=Qipengyuania qiaonensis TaxID=2867240 RepID=A0ABS7J637_9SPHN|nr:FliM/FliN family flagellar motor switch protein [Qipengyuania qiaonensis]MBX7482736.1 FliM/FliN family flagellar motor switch protein [Qipengyuania qiaonensis]